MIRLDEEALGYIHASINALIAIKHMYDYGLRIDHLDYRIDYNYGLNSELEIIESLISQLWENNEYIYIPMDEEDELLKLKDKVLKVVKENKSYGDIIVVFLNNIVDLDLCGIKILNNEKAAIIDFDFMGQIDDLVADIIKLYEKGM